jgi:hypothetical protein
MLNGLWTVRDTSTKKKEASFLPYVLNDRIVYAETKERRFPLGIFYPTVYKQKIEIILPGGWNVPAATKSVSNSVLNYLFKTSVSEESLILEYELNILKPYVDVEDYTAYKSATDYIDKNIVFSAEGGGNENVTKFNYVHFLAVVISIVLAVFFCLYLNRKKIVTPYETRYDGVNSWLVLVVIGLLLSPLILFISVITDFIENVHIDYYNLYFADGVLPSVFMQGVCELLILSFNAFSMVFYVFLAVMCFQRRSCFRIYYILFKIGCIVFITLNIFYLIYLNSENFSGEQQVKINTQQTALIKMIFQFLIMGSYVWFSERSRHTFTVGNNVQTDQPSV